MSPTLLARGRRALGGVTVAALTAGALAVAPSAAHADGPSGATLQWKISQQFADHFNERTLADGATEDSDKVVTFVNGKKSFDAATGKITVAYEGSITGGFRMAIPPSTEPITLYTVTISNPIVEVEESGDGRILATVGSAQYTDMSGAPLDEPLVSGPSSEPAVVTSFDKTSATWRVNAPLRTLTATPQWEGVLPPDSTEALALELPRTRQDDLPTPLEGASFAPTFLAELLSTVRSHFYKSGSGGDPKKSPAPFTATYPVPAPKATDVSTTYGKAATLRVTAPAVGRIAVSGLGTRTVAANQTVTFATPKTLKVGKSRYTATFTPAEITHATPVVSTTATVSVTKAAAKKPKVKVTKKPTSRKKGKAKVTVKGVKGAAAPTGKVRIKLVKGKKSKTVTLKLNKKGVATKKLPKLAKGTWKVRVSYLGNANYTKRGFVKAGKIKVTK